MQAMKLNEVRDVTKDQSSTTELELNPTVHGSHLQTLSKFNKLSEGTKRQISESKWINWKRAKKSKEV